MTTATSIPRSLSRARGDVHRWSRTLIPTSREAPADATLPSHRLLMRGGYIRQVTAGVYVYLPLAWRVLRKVSQIVRDEMDAAGASELLMPTLAPMDFLTKTGRAEAYGDLLFRLEDRHDRNCYLGPTHEEVITDLMIGANLSYRQLPLNLYQIQTKFRDEFRPRAGLLRGREFVMKDAYSFHIAIDGPGGLGETYDAMHRAYTNIFTRCGLDFSAVEAEAGPIGGSASHEFMVNCVNGEDTILACPVSGYAANVEKCEIGPRRSPSKGYFVGDPSGAADDVHTPNCPGIEDVSKLLKVKPENMLKTLLFKVNSTEEQLKQYGEEHILVVVRGDHEVNEGHVKRVSGCPSIQLADVNAAKAMGFAVGFVSPRAAVKSGAVHKGLLVLIDRDAAIAFNDTTGKSQFWVTGADRTDYHTKHFNWQRDFFQACALDMSAAVAIGEPSGGLAKGDHPIVVCDVRNALAGDPSPRADGAALEARRGIEVGHIFKLGTKYSDAMGLNIMGPDQKRQAVIMGCYGIGVSRTMQASVEMSHDDDGIVWPVPLAPYHVAICLLDPETAAHQQLAERIAHELAHHGVDVLIDDRAERPGVKFKDCDLIGIPLRLTIGQKALDAGGVELARRIKKAAGDTSKPAGDSRAVVPLADVTQRVVAEVLG